jgi:DNA-binding NarL/FixJ family response regulator
LPIRILLADDHTVVRQALRLFLADGPDFEIVGEASNGEEAVRLAAQVQPDVVLMDLTMPVMDGLTAISHIRGDHPDIEIVALTSVLEDASVVGAVRAGAIGYLLKDADGEELREAVRAAAAGQVRLSPAAAARLVQSVRVTSPPAALSARETEVLRLLAGGRANKEIAATLGVGEPAIKSTVKALFAKLGVRSRTQAALYAVQVGLVGPS